MFEHFIYHLFRRFDDHGSLSRTVFVEARCEQCGHGYGYALTRSARSIGQRWFWQRPEVSRGRALEEARRELDQRLARGVEVAPCPRCGWIQQRLLERARREFFPLQTWPALFAFILAGIALALMVVLGYLEKAFRLNWEQAWLALVATCILMLCCGILAFVRQQLRARAYDPNTTPVEEGMARGRHRALTREQFGGLYPDADRGKVEA
jgi:hypothetical protein